MRYFPIFIDLDNAQDVLIYGGGEDAARKARLLLKTRAVIKIIGRRLNDELKGLAKSQQLSWIATTFTEDQLDTSPRVIICASDDATNAQVSAAARDRAIPVNVVDRADLSTFIVPAIVDREPLVIAIGTEGAGPVLAQGLRARIEAMVPPTIGGLLNRADALRDAVSRLVPAGAARRQFWKTFFFGAPRDAYLAGDEAGFAGAVEDQLQTAGKTCVAGRISLLDVREDPELLTLKAHRLLQEADIIFYDAAVAPGVLEYARRDAVRRPVGATIWSGGTLDHHKSALALLDKAAQGQLVVRLHDASASALDCELAALHVLNSNSIAIDHIRSSADECTWAPLIDGQTVDGSNPWRLAS